MKMSDLREKSKEDLESKLHELLSDSFTYRTQQVTSRLKQTHLLKKSRKEIARIKTVLSQKAGE